MRGRTPTKAEKDHIIRVANMGCIVCELFHDTYSPSEVHHIRGKTQEGAHFDILPLCHLHHRAGVDCDRFTSRHPYRARFEKRYGAEKELLEIVNKKLQG